MDMVERMAEAMVTAYNPDPEKPGSFRWNFMEGMTNMSEEQKGVYRMFARAALEAMREPTEAMVAAGSIRGIRDDRRSDAENCWLAMIDAALSDQPRPTEEKA